MKKIPTLFKRIFEGHKIVGIINEITPGCEEALKNGKATIKYDGSCCAIINGELYKRYDAKAEKKPPEGAIPCCEPDPVTGHWPHWVKVDINRPEDKWFCVAYNNSIFSMIDGEDGTYEAVGPHFQGNPHNLMADWLIKHGERVVEVGRTFDDIRKWLEENNQEGIVFWLNDEPVCKIKRTDFGYPWNNKK
jgi:hypothetical protein